MRKNKSSFIARGTLITATCFGICSPESAFATIQTNSIANTSVHSLSSVKPNTSPIVKWHGHVLLTKGGFGTFPVPGFVGTPGSLGFGVRYDEDYSYLKNPTMRTDYTDPLKYIPLTPNGDVYITFNGDARVKVDNLSAGNFGIPKSSITYNPTTGKYSSSHCVKCDNATGLYSRVDLGADLHITPYFRVYGELLDGQVNQDAPSSQSPTSRNEMALVQGFAEVNAYLFGGKEGLQVGRQLVVFHWLNIGSSSLPNVFVPSYDGARAYYDNGQVRNEVFYWNLVTPKLGSFEDYTNYTQALWGDYATVVLPQYKLLGKTLTNNIDAFYFNTRSGKPQGPNIADASLAVYRQIPRTNLESVVFEKGSDHRNTFGAEYYGGYGDWHFDYSAAIQTGTYINKHVQGYYIGSITGYIFKNIKWKPNVFIKADIGSSGFEQIGQSTYAIGQNSFITESNLINVAGHVVINPTKSLLVEVFAAGLFRYNQHEGITPGQFSGTSANYGITAFVPGSYVGTILDLRTLWAIAPHLSLSGEAAELVSGTVLKNAHAPNSLYLESQLEYKF